MDWQVESICNEVLIDYNIAYPPIAMVNKIERMGKRIVPIFKLNKYWDELGKGEGEMVTW